MFFLAFSLLFTRRTSLVFQDSVHGSPPSVKPFLFTDLSLMPIDLSRISSASPPAMPLRTSGKSLGPPPSQHIHKPSHLSVQTSVSLPKIRPYLSLQVVFLPQYLVSISPRYKYMYLYVFIIMHYIFPLVCAFHSSLVIDSIVEVKAGQSQDKWGCLAEGAPNPWSVRGWPTKLPLQTEASIASLPTPLFLCTEKLAYC